MSTNGTPVRDEELEVEEEHGRLYEITRKVLLASFGAVALAQEEIEKFVDRLVERGEIAEKDGRKLIEEMRERSRTTLKKSRKRVQTSLGMETRDEEIEDLLERMDIPTKADIQALTNKIAALTRKVEDLKKVQS